MRSYPLRIAFLSLAVCFGAVASAAGWGSVHVLHTHEDCVSETVDVAPIEGNGWMAVWDAANPRCLTGTRHTYQLGIATSGGSGPWRSGGLLPDGFEIPALRTAGGEGLQVYKRDRVLALGARPAEGREPSQLNRVLQVARLSGEGLKRRRDLDGGRLLYGSDGDSGSGLPSDVDDARPVMSLAPNGSGVAVWARLVEDDPDRPLGQVHVRVRDRRGRFGSAKALGAPGQPSGLAVDVNGRGAAAVAWCQDRTDLLLRTRQRGSGWAASEQLGPCSDINQVDLALDDTGTLAVAWASTRAAPDDFSEPVPDGVRVAVGDLDELGRARAVSDDGRDAQVILTATNKALVCWSGPYSGATQGVRFARVDSSGIRAEGSVSAEEGHELVDLAPDARGRGAVLWGSQGADSRGTAFFTRDVNRRGRLGTRQLVYRLDPTEGALVLDAANLGLDPGGRDAAAIWSHARIDQRRARPTRSTVEAAVR